MKYLFMIATFGFFAAMLVSGCSYAVHYDGPYEGKVIDAESGQPLEGVVVLGVWYKETPTAAGAVSSYYDATETITDKNGEFRIPGLGFMVRRVLPVSVLIFKAGYEYENGHWNSLRKHARKIRWEGNKAIIPLRKLTIEEREKRHVDKESILDIKQKLLIKELNKEYKDLGLPLYPETE